MKHYDSQFDVEGRLAPIVIIADLGNNFLKVVLLRYANGLEGATIYETKTTIQHAYVELSPSGWQQEVASSKGELSRRSKALTHSFELKVGNEWKAFKIGDGVANHRENKPLLGSQKYIKGGLDALLVTALLELLPSDIFPDGHDNIILGIGHPPTEFMQVNNMVKIVQPKTGHQVRMPDGSKRNFTIRATIPFDEAIGGLMHMQYNLHEQRQMRDANGRFQKNPLAEGDRLLMLDAGGRLGSIGWINYHGGNNFEVEYDSFQPIEGGMITIRNSIRDNLLAEFSNELKGVGRGGMTDKFVDKILKSKQLVVSGNRENAIDVTDTVNKSLGYLRILRETYRNDFQGGVLADHVAMTGGTISDLYDEITEELNHYSMIPVAVLNEINKANVLGGVHIVLDSLKERQALPRLFQEYL